MPPRPLNARMSLPKGWPRRVRYAIVHAVSMAEISLTVARGWAANSASARVRLKTENDQLRQEISLLCEEMRIKDSRMLQIPAQRRPHYPPVERFAILELRAARHWSLIQAAGHFLVTPLTISEWTKRLDDEGRDALVQLPEPVNRFPEFVGYMIRRLKVLSPRMGSVRIANVLCRAGLHLGSTTVRRMLEDPPRRQPASVSARAGRVVTARRANDVWHTDLTTVPTALGFWISWLPWALPPTWPFCWWIAVAIDHFSRRVVGTEVFAKQPTSRAVQTLLGRAITTGGPPKDIITDRGVQFTAENFARWCRGRKIRQRFGAVGKYGSIAIIERFMRTLKVEGTRPLLVSLRRAAFQRDLSLFVSWYNSERSHSALAVRTPDEVYCRSRPASRAPRLEPRGKWPRRSPCAAPHALIRGRPGARIEMTIIYHAGRKHLPIVQLKRVA